MYIMSSYLLFCLVSCMVVKIGLVGKKKKSGKVVNTAYVGENIAYISVSFF